MAAGAEEGVVIVVVVEKRCVALKARVAFVPLNFNHPRKDDQYTLSSPLDTPHI